LAVLLGTLGLGFAGPVLWEKAFAEETVAPPAAALAPGPNAPGAQGLPVPGPATPPAADVRFPSTQQVDVAGRPTVLQLTGTAVRKAFGLKFYEIAGYCCTTQQPRDVDALAAVDAPKQLILVLERDISENILRRSFEAAFAANDPDGKHVVHIQTLLDHLAAGPLKKGDRITLTHLPSGGVECQVRDARAICVAEPAFAHVVWNVYMGPKGVCPVLRKGLGTHLGVAAPQ